MERDLKVGDRVERINEANTSVVPVGSTGTVIREPYYHGGDGARMVDVRWDHVAAIRSAYDANYVENIRKIIDPSIIVHHIPAEAMQGETITIPAGEYIIKDSGKRQEFPSGMVRDTADDKMQYHRVFDGPMFQRWAEHLTKGAKKYPDTDGQANWMKAAGQAEYIRFRQSALRHFVQWFYGDRDEDHAAAVFFNINGAEYVRENLNV